MVENIEISNKAIPDHRSNENDYFRSAFVSPNKLHALIEHPKGLLLTNKCFNDISQFF